MNPTDITQWLANQLEAAEKRREGFSAMREVGVSFPESRARNDTDLAMWSALSAEREDVKRMDWMERELHDTPFDDDGRPGVVRASDGEAFYGDTLREAIDSALGEPPAVEGGEG